MTYNRFHYNTALWNAGRDEVPALARSIIQAHTGPHIQAVVGASGGTTFISDFVITEGTVKKPPTQYKFPDLGAWIRAYQIRPSSEGTAGGFAKDDLSTFLRAWQFKDLPACIFIVNHVPDLNARIFGLFQADLMATILGKLGEHDLPAAIHATVANLAGQIYSFYAPDLGGRIFVQPPGDLGAIIWSPKDLPAFLGPVQFTDLPARIRGFQFADLPARMLGIPAPQIIAFIRGVAADVKDLPARALPLTYNPGMPAAISPVFTGDTGYKVGLPATIGDDGARSTNFPAFLRSLSTAAGDMGALIKTGGDLDLPAIIQLLGGAQLPAIIETIPEGERDRFLNAFAQSLHPADLGATMTLSENVAFLGASILSLSDTDDLGAFIRVAETFITAILTVSTLASRNLRATIGSPGCSGGSGNYVLGATAVTQHAKSLSATVYSYIEKNLGATVNSEDLFFAYDTIDVVFAPYALPIDPQFAATDTIPILFSPFRGQNLGATINTIQNNVFLNASITPVFPLPRVVPAVNRLTAADLRITEPQNIQEIRLQMEGALLEYIYVNGTENSFISDANEDWKINIRSFKPIAEGLFGDYAAAKVCRLGGLTRFHTMDEAVRFCIQAVLGFESQGNMAATVTASGHLTHLGATLTAQNTFGDLGGRAGRVYPVDFPATVAGVEFFEVERDYMRAYIKGVGLPPGSGIESDMGAYINDLRIGNMFATVSGSGNAKMLGAFVDFFAVNNLGAYIDPGTNYKSLLLPGTSDVITLEPVVTIDGTVEDIFGSTPRQFTVSFWVRWDSENSGQPELYDAILGAPTSYSSRDDGFGFYWQAGSPPSIRFFINNYGTTYVTATTNAATSTGDQWLHVMGTFDADLPSNNMKIYLNGVLKGQATNTISMTGLANPVQIGKLGVGQPAAQYPEQYLDDIGIWGNVALSGTEVTALFDEGVRHLRDLRVNRGAYQHADDLTLYYKFEDAEDTLPGGRIFNVVNSGTLDGLTNDIVPGDIVDFTPSSDSASMYFNNSVYFMATGSDLPLPEDSRGSFTVAVWTNKETTNWPRYVVGMHHTSDTLGTIPRMRIWQGRDASIPRWYFEMNTSGNSPTTLIDYTTTVEESGNTWYHLTATYDSTDGTMLFYTDGVLTASGTLAADSKRINEFTVGSARHANTLYDWQGYLDTVAVWDTVLTATQVSELYNAGDVISMSTLSIDTPQAWYRLGEAGDTRVTILDRSGNDRHLVRTNSGNDISNKKPTN